jgi:hypothetical protein
MFKIWELSQSIILAISNDENLKKSRGREET